MTDCKTIRQRFDDYQSHSLSRPDLDDLEAHLNDCAACREALDAHRAWRVAMAGLPFEPPSPGFEERVLGAVRREAKGRGHRRAFFAGVGVALAASLAVAVVLLRFVPSGGDGSEAMRVAEVMLPEHGQLRLRIQADRPVQDASLSLELPPGLELAGYEGQRRLQWRSDLAAGTNYLSLPLRRRNPQGGELVARVRVGDRTRVIRVRVRPRMTGAELGWPAVVV